MLIPRTPISDFISRKGKLIVFCLVSENDIPQLTDYINALSKEDTFISFSDEKFDLEREKKIVSEWLDLMSRGNMAAIVSFHDQELISHASVTRETRRSKHVGAVALSVKNGFREEGIGSKMLDLLEEAGRKMNLRMLELTVFANNERARHVYKKHGYQDVGVIPEKILYKGDYVDEVIMVKHLT